MKPHLFSRYVALWILSHEIHCALKVSAQVCNVFLVSGEYGVPNGSLTASSSLAPGHAPMYGRLNTSFVQGEHFGGWAPQSASNQFIQVQLNGLSSIQGVATQGRNVTNESQDEQFFFRVTKYEVAYSLDGLSWSTVMNPNMTAKAFQGNTDQNSIHVNWFPCIFEARYVRIHPTEWNIFPTLRFDIIGCPAFAANDSSDCGFENGICGWNQRNENETAVWKTLNGSNASSGQLPYRGHTCTNGK
ncbi:hypothetical protein ACJMK2_025276 [Sinanodonta woodiana]|uniref:F5/8 type C domain-containing protein n=1 Tax=Sinanodonta woodiana TaxID=1069815 RepID=A0ABD3XG10_SINWO